VHERNKIAEEEEEEETGDKEEINYLKLFIKNNKNIKAKNRV
jgi:hypothetical protein